jgi:hypothetical protein
MLGFWRQGIAVLIMWNLFFAPYMVWAQASTSTIKTSPKHAAIAPGSVRDGVYSNPYFGFSCRIPVGWVERTAGMQSNSEDGKSLVLLATFERPPEVAGNTVNSGIIIAAESVASYPGLKSAAEYFAPLSEVTAKNGFEQDGELVEVAIGAATLVRGDFSRRTEKGITHQTSLTMLQRGYVLLFTFISDNPDEIENFLHKLSFAPKITRPR